MAVVSQRRRLAVLVMGLLIFAPLAGLSAQTAPQSRRAQTRKPAMAALIDAIHKRGENTVLSGYVAVVMEIASSYTEQVPAKAIALQADAEHSRLLCLVTKQGTSTIVMTEIAHGLITAYAMTADGQLKAAARGTQYQEFETIPPQQAGAGFNAAKQFWMQQIAAPRALPSPR